MPISFVLSWWHIPTLITVLGIAWALLWPFEEADGWFGCLFRLLPLFGSMVVSMIAWIVAGALK